MRKCILITGGAGFIGAHVSNALLERGYHVRALDALIPQVHGEGRIKPAYLNRDVELIIGDVRDRSRLAQALERVDAVVHLSSLVGVGQSMYQIAEYVAVNNSGTAELLQMLGEHPVEGLVVASVYGEGAYLDESGSSSEAVERSLDQLKAGDWEVWDRHGSLLSPIPTPETKSPALASVYALSKYDQEQMCLIVGREYNIPTVALRLFNTYGPFQALSNPYTGVLSNFAARILNKQQPLVYEDGEQKRDFVSVYDVARAFVLALECPQAAGRTINISNGVPLTVREIATRTIKAIGGKGIQPAITGRYRSGDIRHCFADISVARDVLGWEPQVGLEEGLQDLADWIEGQGANDRGMEAREELLSKQPSPVAHWSSAIFRACVRSGATPPSSSLRMTRAISATRCSNSSVIPLTARKWQTRRWPGPRRLHRRAWRRHISKSINKPAMGDLHAIRDLYSFTGIRLEPRQCPFCARPCQ